GRRRRYGTRTAVRRERRCRREPARAPAVRAWFGTLDLALLAQRLVEHDRDRGREIEAPDMLTRHRDTEDGIGMRGADRRGETAALASEDEQVVLPIAKRRVRARRARREAEEAAGRPSRLESLPVGMTMHVDVPPVVEAGAAKVPVVDGEAERVDQVERRAGGEAEPADRAGILGDLGGDEDDVHRSDLGL